MQPGDDLGNGGAAVTPFDNFAGTGTQFNHSFRIKDDMASLGFLPLKAKGRGEPRNTVIERVLIHGYFQ